MKIKMIAWSIVIGYKYSNTFYFTPFTKTILKGANIDVCDYRWLRKLENAEETQVRDFMNTCYFVRCLGAFSSIPSKMFEKITFQKK